MSSSRENERSGPRSGARIWRLLITASSLLLLGACGFHPLNLENEMAAGVPAMATVKVMPIKDRVGQMLEFSLREAFNPTGVSAEVRYELQVSLVVTRVNLGIQRDASSTRGRVDVNAQFQLVAAHDRKVVYTSHLQSTSDFNIVDDAYAAEVAEQAARAQTLSDITKEIRTRVALFLLQQPQQQHG